MKTLRIYVDTSVVGGCFDDEFSVPSLALMDLIRGGSVRVVFSDLLLRELELAPDRVRGILAELPIEHVEGASLDSESLALRDAYLHAEVVGPAQSNDALHVALASVAKVDMIVSWNFKHIVHYDKIRGFNAVNLREGYLPIEIRSPLEVV